MYYGHVVYIICGGILRLLANIHTSEWKCTFFNKQIGWLGGIQAVAFASSTTVSECYVARPSGSVKREMASFGYSQYNDSVDETDFNLTECDGGNVLLGRFLVVVF